MGSDEAALVRLWREKRGEEEPLDYSDNLIVQLGIATEALNRRWYEKTTGQLIKDVQSPRKRSSGAACRAATPLTYVASSRREPASRRRGLWT
jgi:hypothetical protein